MSDKPKIEVGQRWITRDGEIARVVDVSNDLDPPVTIRCEDVAYTVNSDGRVGLHPDEGDLISLAPSTVKREVALYRYGDLREIFDTDDSRVLDTEDDWRRISEPETIEFTLLPGESA